MRRALTFLLLAIVMATPAPAQRLAGALSERQIEITSDFAGQTLTLFGNVEPAIGRSDIPVEGPFHVIVVVTGPAQNRVVREQTNRFLIWLNTESETFTRVPSYKWVFSSTALTSITGPDTLAQNSISLAPNGDTNSEQAAGAQQLFTTELVRLMTEKGLYGVNEAGVQFRSPTLYSVRIDVPGDVANGTFLAETYLFREGSLIAHQAESFVVRKAGLERLLGDSARDYPLAYGLTCVTLALFTGWLGGVVFRR